MAGRSSSSAIGEVNQLRRRVKEIRRVVELRHTPGASKDALLYEIGRIAAGECDEELFQRKEKN